MVDSLIPCGSSGTVGLQRFSGQLHTIYGVSRSCKTLPVVYRPDLPSYVMRRQNVVFLTYFEGGHANFLHSALECGEVPAGWALAPGVAHRQSGGFAAMIGALFARPRIGKTVLGPGQKPLKAAPVETMARIALSARRDMFMPGDMGDRIALCQ